MQILDFFKDSVYTEQVDKYLFRVYVNHHGQNCCSCVIETPKAKHMPYKIDWAYAYRSLDEAISKAKESAQKYKEAIQKRQERKQAEKVARAQVVASDFYKVGDIVYNSWGWEQTNIEFYRVIEVKNKTIKIEELYLTHAQSISDMAGYVVPSDKKREDGETYTLFVRPKGWLSTPKDRSFYHFSKWDGQPCYRSTYA